MLRFEIDQSGYRPPSKERFRQSSMWIYAFLFGSLMVDGDTLLPHSASVTFPPRAGRICQPIHLNESLSRAAFTAAIPLNDCSLKGDALELGHLEGDISGSGGEIAVVVAAAIPLTLLITLIPGSLGQLVGLRSSSSLSVSSTLPRTSSLSCPLITSSFSCTIFSGMVCCLLSNGVS